MRTDKSLTRRIWLSLALVIFSVAVVQVQPAQAVLSDRGVYAKLQVQRNLLIVKQNDLLRDYDELSREVNDLFRSSNGDSRLIDDLGRQLDATYADLNKIRYDLRVVEMRLL